MHSWLRLISACLNLHISVILLKSCVYLCVLEIIVYLMLLISFTPSLSSWIEWLKWVWSKGAGQKGRGPRSIFSSLALSETLFTWPVFWPVPPPPPPPHTHSLIYLSLDTFRAFHPRVGLRKCKKKALLLRDYTFGAIPLHSTSAKLYQPSGLCTMLWEYSRERCREIILVKTLWSDKIKQTVRERRLITWLLTSSFK